MRCFFAITLDQRIEENIRKFQAKMKLETKRFRDDINWVFPDQCHSTIAFLGDIAENNIKELCEMVDPVAENAKPFRLQVDGLGTFGRNARVLWAGCKKGSEKAGELHEQITEVLKPAGFYTEKKKFSPHITLARIKEPKAGKFVKDIVVPLKRYPFGTMTVKTVDLYKSELTKIGAKYTLLAHFPLGTDN